MISCLPFAAAIAMAAPAAVQTAPAVPVAQPPSGDTAAAIINSEFPAYDADKDGALNEAEFTAWMGALKAKADPSFDPQSADARRWNRAAFRKADADRSKSLSRAELTGFLVGDGP